MIHAKRPNGNADMAERHQLWMSPCGSQSQRNRYGCHARWISPNASSSSSSQPTMTGIRTGASSDASRTRNQAGSRAGNRTRCAGTGRAPLFVQLPHITQAGPKIPPLAGAARVRVSPVDRHKLHCIKPPSAVRRADIN